MQVCYAVWLTSATKTSAPRAKQVFTTNHVVSINCLIKPVTYGPRLQAYKNTLIRQNIPETQSSSPRSYPRVIPEVRSFLRTCRVQETQTY